MSSSPDAGAVRRRRVFYIPGYDPFHPRRYRELYRSEGRDQARLSGYDLRLRPADRAHGTSAYGWQVETEIDGQRCSSDFEVLFWSDLVRDSMSASIGATYLQLVRTAWIYVSSGALWRLMRLRKGPVIAALYPVALLLVQGMIALGLGLGVAIGIAALGGAGTEFLGATQERFFAAAQMVLALGGGTIAALWVLRRFRALDNRFFAYYLMHDYAHTAQLRGAIPDDLDERMKRFSATIRAALADPTYDEVLVVGHSSGAHIGVMVLADLLRDGELPGSARLGFLTLGQVVPMLSFLPRAWRLRRDLQILSRSDTLVWYDVTAPGDGCAFALCDPVAVSGVADQDQRWPVVFSAAFTQSLTPARWQALKRRYFRLHFQYLCAFDAPRDYDYFQITAGPLTLADRYRTRRHSASRMARPVNRFTTVQPPQPHEAET